MGRKTSNSVVCLPLRKRGCPFRSFTSFPPSWRTQVRTSGGMNLYSSARSSARAHDDYRVVLKLDAGAGTEFDHVVRHQRIHYQGRVCDMVNLTRAKDAALNWVRPPGRGTTTDVVKWNRCPDRRLADFVYSAAGSASYERRMGLASCRRRATVRADQCERRITA